MDAYRMLFLTIFTLIVFHTSYQFSDDDVNMASLSRRKRYIVFPEGSTFSVAFGDASKRMLTPVNRFTFGYNWAVSYELPNETVRDPETNRIVPPFNIRRHRRELYGRLEVAMNSAGLDGRSCIKRTLCEAAQRLLPKATISEEILRVLFTLPLQKVDTSEPIEHHIYDAAHRLGLSNRNCPDLYPTCSISLIDMVLGPPGT